MRARPSLFSTLVIATACQWTGAARPTPPAPAPDAAERGGLVAALFRDPALSQLRLSPDGARIAGIATQHGVRWIVVRATQGGPVRFLAKLDEPGQRIRQLGWAGDGRILASVEMPSLRLRGVRARQSRLFAVSPDEPRVRYVGRYWPYSQWQDQIIDWLWDDPDHVLINWWPLEGRAARGPRVDVRAETGGREPRGASVRRVDLRSGRLLPVVDSVPLVTGWAADHRGNVRAGWGAPTHRSGYFLVARIGPTDAFEKVIDFDPFSEPGFFFAGFSSDPGIIYVISSDESGRDALYTYDLASRRLGPLVFRHPEVDLGELRFSPRDGRLRSIEITTDRPRIYFLDDDARREQEAIDRRFPGTTNRITSRDRDGNSAIVEVSGDTTPPRYYHYRRGSRRIDLLVEAYPDVDRRMLAPMEPVAFRARDGLEIPAYLTLPKGVPPSGLPAVLVVHGGPASRDVWGWNPTVQLLASRGFAVLQPNFRGSSGYGRRYEELGHRQWGLAMQDDLEDAAHWLIGRGIADPSRIGIYGASYGGYAALMALVESPELFAAAASWGGVTDLPTKLGDDAWHRSDAANGPTLGGRWSHREQLRQTSPARHAGRIGAPVLIAHGTADETVHVKHAERMAKALEARGVPVETWLYPDEAHHFVHERSRIDFHERLVAFFARHLAPAVPVAAGAPGTSRSGPDAP